MIDTSVESHPSKSAKGGPPGKWVTIRMAHPRDPRFLEFPDLDVCCAG